MKGITQCTQMVLFSTRWFFIDMINQTTYAGNDFWSRKVFEGVRSHVMNMLRKCDFGPYFYYKFGPKSQIRTIEKWTKITFSRVIINFGPLFNSKNLRFWSRFETKIWTKITFSNRHVRMNSSKHFSGPKNQPRYT